MTSICTGRLMVRTFVPEDWKDLREVVIDKEASELAVYDHPFPTSDKEIQEIAAWFSQGNAFFAICDAASGRVIGYISFDGKTDEQKNLGFCLHSAYQGKGYAIEACTALINYAFENTGLQKITSGTANANHPARRLLEKLGFSKTGESMASFRKAPDGSPIEFVGSSFVLDRRHWMARAYKSDSRTV